MYTSREVRVGSSSLNSKTTGGIHSEDVPLGLNVIQIVVAAECY